MTDAEHASSESSEWVPLRLTPRQFEHWARMLGEDNIIVTGVQSGDDYEDWTFGNGPAGDSEAEDLV